MGVDRFIYTFVTSIISRPQIIEQTFQEGEEEFFEIHDI